MMVGTLHLFEPGLHLTLPCHASFLFLRPADGADAATFASTIRDNWLTNSEANNLHTLTNDLRSSFDNAKATQWCAIADNWAASLDFADFTTVFNAMEAMDTLKTAANDMSDYISALQAIAADLSGIPDSMAQFRSDIADVRSAADTALDVSALLNALQGLKTRLDSMPSLSVILAQIDEVRGMSSVIDAFLDLRADFKFVNETFVSLPDSFDDLLKEIPTLNTTYYAYLQVSAAAMMDRVTQRVCNFSAVVGCCVQDLESYEAELNDLESERTSQGSKVTPYITQVRPPPAKELVSPRQFPHVLVLFYPLRPAVSIFRLSPCQIQLLISRTLTVPVLRMTLSPSLT